MSKQSSVNATRMIAAGVLLAVAGASGCMSSSHSDDPQTAKKAAANTNTEADSGAPRDAGDAPAACSWPARLDRGDDAALGACHAKRRLLTCALAGGATEICLSDATQCEPDAGEAACDDKCKPDEYAVACGAIGPNTGTPDPPAACHDASSTPGGVFFMCCPCE
jgi:hypothetical protein